MISAPYAGHALRTTIYARGLRLTQGASLTPADVDSAHLESALPRSDTHGTAHAVEHGGPHANRSSLQSAFRRAVRTARIHKRAHDHSLRHSYATHLLESGVSLRLIQSTSATAHLGTTAIYTQLTRSLHDAARAPIDELLTKR